MTMTCNGRTLTFDPAYGNVAFLKVQAPAHLADRDDMYGVEDSPMYAMCTWGDPEVPALYIQKFRFEQNRDDWQHPISQWLVWYPKSGQLWHGYGESREDAIQGAIKAGWEYA